MEFQALNDDEWSCGRSRRHGRQDGRLSLVPGDGDWPTYQCLWRCHPERRSIPKATCARRCFR